MFCHPPEDQEPEEFDCWALCWFIHVTEEGEEAGLFNGLTGGDNIAEATEVAEIVPNNMSESTEMEDSDNNSPPRMHSFWNAAQLPDLLQSTMMMPWFW